MRTYIIAAILITPPASTLAQQSPSERWEVTSTVVDLTVPGAPGFLIKMAKGKSRAERKCVPVGQTVAALLAPDPKAKCRIDSQQITDGRYVQSLNCPQRRGEPLIVHRVGTYDINGFAGRAEMTGQIPKGAMRIVLSQRAARASGVCRG